MNMGAMLLEDIYYSISYKNNRLLCCDPEAEENCYGCNGSLFDI